MTGLFVHDHKFHLHEGRYYTSGGLPDSVLSRYTKAFGKMTVAGRILKDNYAKAGQEITNPDIQFVDISRNCFRTLWKAAAHADFIISRVPSLSGYIAVFCAWLQRKPYLLEVVGDPVTSLWYHGALKCKLAMPFMWGLLKLQTRFSGNVLYVSRMFLQKRYPTSGRSFCCPDVDLDTPDEEILRQRLTRICALDPRCFTVGLIGSCAVNYRGHETLLRSVAELKRQGICCRVRFLGGGDSGRWQALAEQLAIADQVEFCGVLPAGAAVLQWIDEIDILAMPTRQETLGRAIIEAMSRGCPILGSQETAIGEQIGSDCLFKADDFATLATMIQAMVNDREYMKACARENFWRSYKYMNSRCNAIRENIFARIIADCS